VFLGEVENGQSLDAIINAAKRSRKILQSKRRCLYSEAIPLSNLIDSD
jgi:hypothetical protein